VASAYGLALNASSSTAQLQPLKSTGW